MYFKVTVFYLIFAGLSSVVRPISTEEAKAHGELRFYPSGRVTHNKNGRKSALTINLQAKKKHMAEKLRKIYNDNNEKCSAFNTEITSQPKCSPSDNFGESSDYFCFFLRLEKTQHWKPRGFTKTPFLPSYNKASIPVTCYLTAGYRFAPLGKYEKTVQLQPVSGFPLSYFSGEKQPKECSPLVTGIIDDPHLFDNYFEYRKLQCKVWDFAKLKHDHVTILLNVKGQQTVVQSTNLNETTESNAIPLISQTRKEANGTDDWTVDKLHASELRDLTDNSVKEDGHQEESNEEFLERRDPSAPVQSLYEELDLDVPASK